MQTQLMDCAVVVPMKLIGPGSNPDIDHPSEPAPDEEVETPAPVVPDVVPDAAPLPPAAPVTTPPLPESPAPLVN